MKKLTNKEWNNINRAYELSYICDSAADIASLPTEDVAAGSLALCVGEGDAYLFSASGEWKKFGKGSISGGGSQAIITPLIITENGIYTAEDCDGYAPITVSVPQIEKEYITITENGSYVSNENQAWGMIDVNVPQLTTETLTVTENGSYSAPDGTAYDSVEVNVEGGGSAVLQEQLTVTQNGTYNPPIKGWYIQAEREEEYFNEDDGEYYTHYVYYGEVVFVTAEEEEEYGDQYDCFMNKLGEANGEQPESYHVINTEYKDGYKRVVVNIPAGAVKLNTRPLITSGYTDLNGHLAGRLVYSVNNKKFNAVRIEYDDGECILDFVWTGSEDLYYWDGFREDCIEYGDDVDYMTESLNNKLHFNQFYPGWENAGGGFSATHISSYTYNINDQGYPTNIVPWVANMNLEDVGII